MLPLRHPWFWWTPGLVLVAAVSIGSLTPGEYLPEFSIGDKLQHAGAYLVLTVWFAGIYPRERHWAVACLIFALGLALDVAQLGSPSRSFDLADVAANAGGILVGLALGWSLLAGWCGRVEQRFLS